MTGAASPAARPARAGAVRADGRHRRAASKRWSTSNAGRPNVSATGFYRRYLAEHRLIADTLDELIGYVLTGYRPQIGVGSALEQAAERIADRADGDDGKLVPGLR